MTCSESGLGLGISLISRHCSFSASALQGLQGFSWGGCKRAKGSPALFLHQRLLRFALPDVGPSFLVQLSTNYTHSTIRRRHKTSQLPEYSVYSTSKGVIYPKYAAYMFPQVPLVFQETIGSIWQRILQNLQTSSIKLRELFKGTTSRIDKDSLYGTIIVPRLS